MNTLESNEIKMRHSIKKNGSKDDDKKRTIPFLEVTKI